MATRVRPHVYRDTPGFSVTGSPHGSKGFPVSIFVRCRSTAVRIRKLLNAPLPSTANGGYERYKAAHDAQHAKIDTLIRADARVKVCKR